jgi:hypothetical protein
MCPLTFLPLWLTSIVPNFFYIGELFFRKWEKWEKIKIQIDFFGPIPKKKKQLN